MAEEGVTFLGSVAAEQSELEMSEHPDAESDYCYGMASLGYRSASTLPLPIDTEHGRAPLPMRPGVGTNVEKQHTEHVSVRYPLLDGRRLIEEGGRVPTLDEEGYAHARHVSKMFDGAHSFWDMDDVLDVYMPEIEGIVRANVPGAHDATVLIFDHAIRTGGEVLRSDDPQFAQANPYAAGVHSDATCRSGHTRAKDQILGTNETVTKYGRVPACWGDVRPGREAQRAFFKPETIDHNSPEGEGGDHLIINVWRPILGPVKQWPLVLLDARTVSQEDVHPSILNIYDNSPGGKSGISESRRPPRCGLG
jgi:hypothetical protein